MTSTRVSIEAANAVLNLGQEGAHVSQSAYGMVNSW